MCVHGFFFLFFLVARKKICPGNMHWKFRPSFCKIHNCIMFIIIYAKTRVYHRFIDNIYGPKMKTKKKQVAAGRFIDE